jgi:hypothetical protein
MTDLSVKVKQNHNAVLLAVSGDGPGSLVNQLNDIQTKNVWLAKMLEIVNANLTSVYDVQMQVLKHVDPVNAEVEVPLLQPLPTLRSVMPVKAPKIRITQFPNNLKALTFPLPDIVDLVEFHRLLEADSADVVSLCEYLGNKFPSEGNTIANVTRSILNHLFSVPLLKKITWKGTQDSHMKKAEEKWRAKNPGKDCSHQPWMEEKRESFKAYDGQQGTMSEMVQEAVKWSFTCDSQMKWTTVHSEKAKKCLKDFLQRKIRGKDSTFERQKSEQARLEKMKAAGTSGVNGKGKEVKGVVEKELEKRGSGVSEDEDSEENVPPGRKMTDEEYENFEATCVAYTRKENNHEPLPFRIRQMMSSRTVPYNMQQQFLEFCLGNTTEFVDSNN